jgi:hypothetical protein
MGTTATEGTTLATKAECSPPTNSNTGGSVQASHPDNTNAS